MVCHYGQTRARARLRHVLRTKCVMTRIWGREKERRRKKNCSKRYSREKREINYLTCDATCFISPSFSLPLSLRRSCFEEAFLPYSVLVRRRATITRRLEKRKVKKSKWYDLYQGKLQLLLHFRGIFFFEEEKNYIKRNNIAYEVRFFFFSSDRWVSWLLWAISTSILHSRNDCFLEDIKMYFFLLPWRGN